MITEFSRVLQRIQENRLFQFFDLGKAVTVLVEEISQQRKMVISLDTIRTTDNQALVHALNTAILSTAIGVRMGMNPNELKRLAMGALLHDIGKFVTPQQLKEEERDRCNGDHTWRGFFYLRQFYEIGVISAQVSLQHHEHMDGTGYPRQISGDKMLLEGKIAAVANAFDHLISTTSPSDASYQMVALAGRVYDQTVINKLIDAIAFYPNGYSVLLKSGLEGTVVGQNEQKPRNPIIALGPGNQVINLAEETDDAIEKVWIG